MAKLSIDKLSGLAPIGKDVVLNYERDGDYSGKVESLTMRIYPLKVNEELELQQITEDNKVNDTDQDDVKERKGKALEEVIDKMIFYTLQKGCDGDVTMANARALPGHIKEEIIKQLYLFKGVDITQIQKKKIEETLAKA
jgi:hypothetical protein